MAYHPGVGVSSLATSAPTLLKSFASLFYWTDFDKILLTIQNISPILILEHLFVIVSCGRGLEDVERKWIGVN